MPNLKFDERMQRCEFEEHDDYKRQKYYIVRSYASEIERHFCFGCCQIMSHFGHLKYDGTNGFVPTNSTVEKLLNIYGINGYYEVHNPPTIRRTSGDSFGISGGGIEPMEFGSYEEANNYFKENVKWNSTTKRWL